MLHVPHNKVPKPEFIHTSIPDDRQEAYTRPTYPSMESYTRRNTDNKPHNAVFDKIAVPLPGLLTFKKPVGYYPPAKTQLFCGCELNHDPYKFPRIG